MSRFDKFFQMTVDDIVEYTLEKTSGQIDWDKESMHALVPPEHGNLNYVYRVWDDAGHSIYCLLYTSPSPRDRTRSRMPSSA